jgi:hypothetical protein
MNAQAQIPFTQGRTDLQTAIVVAIAIELQGARGCEAAAKFLTAYGTDFCLTVRVLSEPDRRRRFGFERAVEGLTGGKPVPLTDFERRIAEKVAKHQTASALLRDIFGSGDLGEEASSDKV